jgi:hypothetical protein
VHFPSILHSSVRDFGSRFAHQSPHSLTHFHSTPSNHILRLRTASSPRLTLRLRTMHLLPFYYIPAHNLAFVRWDACADRSSCVHRLPPPLPKLLWQCKCIIKGGLCYKVQGMLSSHLKCCSSSSLLLDAFCNCSPSHSPSPTSSVMVKEFREAHTPTLLPLA